jgi:hypothetical protein
MHDKCHETYITFRALLPAFCTLLPLGNIFEILEPMLLYHLNI